MSAVGACKAELWGLSCSEIDPEGEQGGVLGLVGGAQSAVLWYTTDARLVAMGYLGSQMPLALILKPLRAPG